MSSPAVERRKPRRRREAPGLGARLLRGVLGAAVGVVVTVVLRRVTSALAPQPCAAFPTAASMLGAANDRAAPAFLRMKQRIAAAHAARME